MFGRVSQRGVVVTGAAVVASALVAGCGSGKSSTPTSTSTQVQTSSNASAPAPGISGRWEQVHTCKNLAQALNRAGLGATAPYSVGDFFPGKSPQSLIHKADLCKGAVSFRHSHFFTRTGQFGSLDQNQNQVDNGSYQIIGPNTVHITSPPGIEGTFHYRVLHGNTLALDPIITATQRRQALARPSKFTSAVWMVSVAYPGTTWKRVACGGFC
jgi:hypothetical protein